MSFRVKPGNPGGQSGSQQGEDAFRRCFTEQAPRQAAYAAAVKQAQALLEMAMGR